MPFNYFLGLSRKFAFWIIRKPAFTLAEVLITLSIIGVVAAMTLPTLIKKYEKHVIEVQLKKTYSDLENMITRAEVDNESYEYWDFEDPNWYNKYFQPYLHARDCKGKNISYCFLQNGTAGVFRFANGNLVDANSGHWAVAPRYVLPDGRAIIIEPIYDTTFDRYWKFVHFVVDVNGSKGPCVMGWDVFQFTLFNYTHGSKKIGLKLGSIGGGDGAYTRTSERIKQECYNSGGYDCGLLIQRNNWKFPEDYPLKY